MEADESIKKSYLNLWNVIGQLLGIDPKILPENYLSAAKADREIAGRQFQKSPQGIELANSLMSAFRNVAPGETIGNLLQEQSRYLLGNNYAEMLEIKKHGDSLLRINTTSV